MPCSVEFFIHRDVAVAEELPEVFFPVDAVTKGSSERIVLCHLGIFQFDPLEVGSTFFLRIS